METCFEYGNCVVTKVRLKSGRTGFETLQLGATAMYVIGYFGSDYYFRAVTLAYEKGGDRYRLGL